MTTKSLKDPPFSFLASVRAGMLEAIVVVEAVLSAKLVLQEVVVAVAEMLAGIPATVTITAALNDAMSTFVFTDQEQAASKLVI